MKIEYGRKIIRVISENTDPLALQPLLYISK